MSLYLDLQNAQGTGPFSANTFYSCILGHDFGRFGGQGKAGQCVISRPGMNLRCTGHYLRTVETISSISGIPEALRYQEILEQAYGIPLCGSV